MYVYALLGRATEKHGEALTVSLDIAKAFDRVWHASLLDKLPEFGIPVGLCNWISDFLSRQSIRVVVDGCSSDLMTINASVYQGSVLSATLFLLHIDDLLQHARVLEYADDSTVSERYFSCGRASRDETTVLREAMVERMSFKL